MSTPECLCDGSSGTFTVSLPAHPAPGEVTSTELLCPLHGVQLRRVVYDSSTNKTGEIMDRLTKDHRPAVWLRKVGGGIGWTAFVDDLRPEVPTAGTTT